MRPGFVFLFAALVVGSPREPNPEHPKAGDLPPLPPASGTPVGYLLDARGDLKLRDDQVTKLTDIDQSLAAHDAEIDTQLRQIEHADPEEQPQRGQPPRHRNNAPGASGAPSGDAAKLHQIRNSNDREALPPA